MSQAGILTPPGGGGGGIDIRTITGNDAIAVGPNLAHNLNLVGADGITVTNTAANTLTVTGSSIAATVQTLDATATALYTLAVGASSSVIVTATIVAAEDDYSEAYWGYVVFGARRAVGAATGVEMSSSLTGNDAVPLVTAYGDVSGNNIRIMVIGQLASTWNWKATINYVVQS